MSPLQEYFEKNRANAIDKWLHYFDIYDFWFKKYKNKQVVILEIGIFQGGSLNMWRNYLGKDAKLYGIDANPLCKQFESENTKIFIGSQEDREFLRKVKAQIPKIDILIDDGGHTMNQQITTFEEMYDHVTQNGIYVCEDLHTSYWEVYGGGFKRESTFIEYSKTLIDRLNAWHVQDGAIEVSEFTRSTYSLHYYDSVLVIQKKLIERPTSKVTGKILIPISTFPSPNQNALQDKKNSFFIKKLKTILQKLWKK